MKEVDANLDFEIFETLLFDANRDEFILLEEHLQRMEKSSEALGFAFSRSGFLSCLDEVQARLRAVGGSGSERWRIRVSLMRGGSFSQETHVLSALERDSLERGATLLPAEAFLDSSLLISKALQKSCTGEKPKVALSRRKIDPHAAWLRHKTTRRAIYDEEFRSHCSSGPFYEILFSNTRDELTEGSRTNVLLQLQDSDRRWLTPALSSGLLDGVFRQTLLRRSDVRIEEAVLKTHHLSEAQRIFVMNSVRGLVEVSFHGPIESGTVNS